MDAGEYPSNNGGVKVSSCNESLAHQQWSPIVEQNIVKTVNSEYPSFPLYHLHCVLPANRANA
jgi:hypothetical protein